jgi:hypothetical protein
MAVTIEQLNSFQQFAMQRLSVEAKPSTIDELLMEWQDQLNRDELAPIRGIVPGSTR